MMQQEAWVLLVEECHLGLAEHAAPVVREWLRRGYSAVLACATADVTGFEKLVHDGFYGGVPDVCSFDDWTWDRRVDVMLSVLPGSPGPLFRDVLSPTDIPRIALPHGLTDKRNKFPADFIGHPLGYFNVLLASGLEMFHGSWEDYYAVHPEVEWGLCFEPVGVPKTDAMINGVDRKTEIIERFQLDAARPTVLYAPTFQREASLEQAGETIVQTLAGMDVNVLIRLHHLSVNLENKDAMAAHGGRDWRARGREWMEQYPNIRFVEGDSTDYFIAADVLVGDVSGACYEFMLQDKPVIFWDVPLFFEKQGTDGIAFYGRDAGVIVSSAESLSEAVTSAVHGDDPASIKRGALIQRLAYHRGYAAAVAVDGMERWILELEPYPKWGVKAVQREDLLLEQLVIERLQNAALKYESIALYGAGQHTRRLLKLIEKACRAEIHMPRIDVILDDHPLRCSLQGIVIRRPAEISRPDCVVLSTDYFQQQMTETMRNIWGDDIPVINLYAGLAWYKPRSCAV